MSYKIKISKPGYNVLTETDPNNLIFSSDFNTLKYFTSGNSSLTITASGAGQQENTATVAHNLGYIPFFTGYIYDSTNYYINPVNGYTGFNYGMYADSTNLYLYGTKYFFTSGSITIYFYYKLFKNNINL